MTTDRPIIQTRGLTKVFGANGTAVHALRGIDLTVQRGEFVALMGPSGSGKSTLMAIIGCLDSPTAGTYDLDGVPVQGLSGAALARVRNEKLGFVFQTYNLLPRASIARNVELPLLYAGDRAQGAAPAGSRAARAGRDSPRRRTPCPPSSPAASASGWPSRAPWPTAPALLLADEPTGALDSRTGEEVLGLFKELHRRGNSVVLVTHDPHIASFAERRVELRDGLVVEPEAQAA